jgi:ATP-dependent helicase/nuclease subunit B
LSLQSLLTEGVTVLTASRRLAHAVKQQFARESQARGATIWQTPRVLPWGAWLRQQHLDARTKAAARWRVLSPAQSRALWDEVVSNSRAASELLNPSSAARLAARSWRLLHDYLIPIERLQGFETPEAQALLAWCNEFSRRCDTLGAIDEAQLAHWAFDIELAPSERLTFAGFDAMPPAMTRLMERWRAADLLAETVESAAPGSVSVFEADDHDSELAVAAQWARDELAQGRQSIGIIVTDLQSRRDEIRRVFEDVLTPGARHTQASSGPLPAVIAAPAPLSSYPLVDAAMLVLQMLVGDAPSTQAGRLLRSVFIGGGNAEQGARAMADRRLRDEQRDGWDWPKLERWAALTECDQLLLRSRELNALARALPSSALASEWAERFHLIWRSIGWPGDRVLSSIEFQTLQKFQETLAEFGSLDPVTGRMSLRRAVGRLGDVLRDTPFEPETVSAAITVIDPATSAGMRFDALWVTGLDADGWPASASPDALIPLELQRTSAMPEATAARMLQQALTQLDRWQRSADRVVLSWAGRDGDIELNRSPLLGRLRADEALLTHASPTVALRELLFRERPPLEVLRDDRAPALPRKETRGGSRTIELQSRCPFRAQAEIRLRADALPRVGVGIEPIDRGAILHRVLEDLWGVLRTQQRLLELDDLEIERRVRESAQRHALQALSIDTPSRHRLAMLEIDSVTRQIVQLLQQEKLRPGFSVHLAEAKEAYEIGGLSITLRPDRIDQLDAGGELLIDYKLGASHTQRGWFDSLPGRPRQPQLPLYGLAHAERLRGLSYVILAPGAVEYRGWSDGTPIASGVLAYPAGIRTDLGDPADWGALLHHWQFTLTRLAEHYVAGRAEVDPLPQECMYCHLSTLCRVNELALEPNEEGSASDE